MQQEFNRLGLIELSNLKQSDVFNSNYQTMVLEQIQPILKQALDILGSGVVYDFIVSALDKIFTFNVQLSESKLGISNIQEETIDSQIDRHDFTISKTQLAIDRFRDAVFKEQKRLLHSVLKDDDVIVNIIGGSSIKVNITNYKFNGNVLGVILYATDGKWKMDNCKAYFTKCRRSGFGFEVI